MPDRLPQIGVLASHEGSVLQAVIDATRDQRLQAGVGLVISNNSQSGALRRAAELGIPGLHLSTRTHRRPVELDRAIANALSDARIDIVLLAGYMRRLGPVTLDTFAGQLLNTHPSLLPRYGGRGFFGLRVHEAVLAAGDTESGATVHVVERDYDSGPILAQARVPVLPDDTPESLEQRVKRCERDLLITTLDEFARQQTPHVF